MLLSENVYCVAIAFKITEWIEQQICINFCIKLEHFSGETIWMIDSEGCSYGQLVIGRFIKTTYPLMHHIWCSFLAKQPRWFSTHYCPDLVPCNFCLLPKLKSPLKGKVFQTLDEMQENMRGQLMVIRRTVWGPKVTTLKRIEVSLSCVQCFLCLVSSSINVSIFHITRPDTFWTDLAYVGICVHMY